MEKIENLERQVEIQREHRLREKRLKQIDAVINQVDLYRKH